MNFGKIRKRIIDDRQEKAAVNHTVVETDRKLTEAEMTYAGCSKKREAPVTFDYDSEDDKGKIDE